MPAAGKDNPSTKQPAPTMYQISTNNPDNGEYSDQELLDLVNYFEVSRVELKNVGNQFYPTNLFFMNFSSVWIPYLHSPFLNRNKSILKRRNYSKVSGLFFSIDLIDLFFSDDYIKSHGNSLSLKLYSQGDQITLAIASV